MPILIVEEDRALASGWVSQLARLGQDTVLCRTASEAFDLLAYQPISLLVVDFAPEFSEALALADFLAIRQPNTRVLFVAPARCWPAARLFLNAPNACGVFGRETPASDLAHMVVHHAAAGAPN